MQKRGWLLLSVAALGLIILIGISIFNQAFKNNILYSEIPHEITIRDYESFDQILEKIAIKKILIDTSSFALTAKIMGYAKGKIRPGRYLVKYGLSNYKIIAKLRSGQQDPVQLKINNVRDITQLCSKLSNNISLDSTTLLNKLSDSLYLHSIGYTKEDILCLFIPNTYEMYWNISFDNFIKRMITENEKFWSKENRKSKAAERNLKPNEVYTLASIVEKETTNADEKPTIAGVYLNRLKIGMKLQADPTVVFALGVSGIQRVLLEHLSFKSPFNTYQIEGLPPGPIYMPSVNSIDAVLNSEKHDYIFFCAKPGYDGSHLFATGIDQHYQNARIYQKWLNAEKIR